MGFSYEIPKTLSDIQKKFLFEEMGILKFEPENMSPLELWLLREKLFDFECDTKQSDDKRNEAAHIVDYLLTIIPEGWNLELPGDLQLELPPYWEYKLPKRVVDKLSQVTAKAV